MKICIINNLLIEGLFPFMRKEVIYSFNQKYFIEICVVLFSQLRTFLVTEAAIFV